MTALGWTVSDALGQFDAAGMPVDQAGFRAVVRAARRTGNLKPLGETRSGERGGRGQILYPIADLQRLHSALAPWLISREAEGALHGVLPVVLPHGEYSSGMAESPERRRERYANDPEYRARADAYHAAYVAKNRARLNAQKRAAYAANPERTRTMQNAWRAANPAKVAEQNRRGAARRNRAQDRAKQLYRQHGITPGEWAEMWTAQDGRCYLCGAGLAPEPCRTAVVDHDHSCCGPQKSCAICRRGIACRPCNSIIGLAGDSPARLHQIAERLQVALSVHAQRLKSRPAAMSALFELAADDELESVQP